MIKITKKNHHCHTFNTLLKKNEHKKVYTYKELIKPNTVAISKQTQALFDVRATHFKRSIHLFDVDFRRYI